MICFPSMLVLAALAAGIPVPPGDILEDPNLYRESYPQFFILCCTQLGRPLDHGEHFDNAKNLAKIPVDVLKTLTAQQLQFDYGVDCGLV